MVSVIIPTYNRENTIVRAVNSILNQSYKDLEVIVVDDCSRDNTIEVVSMIQDARVRIIKCEKNGGACVARNIGIEHAKGRYIAFQDSDDEWYPNKLEIQLEKLNSTNSDIVACSFYKCEGKKVKQWPPSEITGHYLERILKGNYVTTQAILAKRECFQNEKFDEKLPRYQDWELVIRLLGKYKFYFINEPLLNAYVQKDSITNNFKAGAVAAMYILEKHKETYQKYPGSDKILKKIFAYGKMREGNFEHNYYKDILREYKFDLTVAIRSLEFELRKLRR